MWSSGLFICARPSVHRCVMRQKNPPTESANLMQLPPQTEALVDLLNRMIQLMEWDGQTFWLERTKESVALLRNGKREGFSLFLSGFGTAGSFNECSVGKGEWTGKVHTWHPGHEDKYKEFEALKSESYGLAKELDRETEPSIFESIKVMTGKTTLHTRVLLATLSVLLIVTIVWRPR